MFLFATLLNIVFEFIVVVVVVVYCCHYYYYFVKSWVTLMSAWLCFLYLSRIVWWTSLCRLWCACHPVWTHWTQHFSQISGYPFQFTLKWVRMTSAVEHSSFMPISDTSEISLTSAIPYFFHFLERTGCRSFSQMKVILSWRLITAVVCVLAFVSLGCHLTPLFGHQEGYLTCKNLLHSHQGISG